MPNHDHIKLKNELRETKDKLSRIKTELYNEKQNQMHIMNEYEKLLEYKDKSVEIEKYNELLHKYNTVTKEFEHLNREVLSKAKYVEEIDNLKDILRRKNEEFLKSESNKKLSIQGSTIAVQNKEIKRLENALNELSNRNKYNAFQEVEFNINKAISFLNNSLNYRTIGMYDKVAYLCKKVDDMKKIIDNVQRIKPSKYKRKDITFGTITEDLMFADYSGKIYTISESCNIDISEHIDKPCKAQIKHGGESVSICYIYEEQNEIKNNAKKIERKYRHESLTYQPKYNKEIRLLLVGAINKVKYTEALRKYGLKVVWFDSFCESPQKLKDLYKSSDIVVLFKDHMRHYVLNIVDTNRNNVATIGMDSTNSLMSTVNYLILKNNLADIFVEEVK